MLHELKINSEFVEPIMNGDKTFEIRQNDRGFQKGDFVKFKVNLDDWNINNRNKVRQFESKVYAITYVLNGWGLKNGYVVFGIHELPEYEDIGTPFD